MNQGSKFLEAVLAIEIMLEPQSNLEEKVNPSIIKEMIFQIHFQNSFASTSFCRIIFLFCLDFFLSHLEIIRCILKSLITTSTYFLLQHN